MHLRRLELEEFRAYRRLELDIGPAGLRVVGPNASGKSSLLEAIDMLATTRSSRSSAEREVIRWGSGAEFGVPPFARLRGVATTRDGDADIEIGLQLDAQRPNLVRKQIKVSGRPVRALDAVGRIKTVLFGPEDVGLVAGSPVFRRRYLDRAISQIDPQYLRSLARFARVVEQRNSLLKALQRDRVPALSPAATGQLAFWDAELVANGAAILARRLEIVGRLAVLADRRFAALSAHGAFEIAYSASLAVPVAKSAAPGGPGASVAVIAREYEDRLPTIRVDEIRRGVTLIGPHRDDLGLAIGGIDVGTFGSRGQQRLAVVALKLAEVDLMAEAVGEPPILLLDDVLSELDAAHRALLARAAVETGAQLFVTATDESELTCPVLRDVPLLRFGDGAEVS